MLNLLHYFNRQNSIKLNNGKFNLGWTRVLGILVGLSDLTTSNCYQSEIKPHPNKTKTISHFGLSEIAYFEDTLVA